MGSDITDCYRRKFVSDKTLGFHSNCYQEEEEDSDNNDDVNDTNYHNNTFNINSNLNNNIDKVDYLPIHPSVGFNNRNMGDC